MKITLTDYKKILVLTGAGVSVASGLGTYRGAGGIRKNYDVEVFGHIDRVKDDPQKIWELFGQLRAKALSAEPNPAHLLWLNQKLALA